MTSTLCFCSVRLEITTPSPQQNPDASAAIELSIPPSPCHGAMIASSPTAQTARPQRNLAVIFSPSSSQANRPTQNGMV